MEQNSLLERRALVVDDDETLRVMVRRQLQRMGFEVQSVRDGIEAVNACRNTDFHVILMDVQMPNMDGYEATREIREMEKRDARNPMAIIAITASFDREKALQSGMDDCLSKPFVFEALKEIVDKCTVGRAWRL